MQKYVLKIVSQSYNKWDRTTATLSNLNKMFKQSHKVNITASSKETLKLSHVVLDNVSEKIFITVKMYDYKFPLKNELIHLNFGNYGGSKQNHKTQNRISI